MTSLSENTVVTTSGGLVELGYVTASTTVTITQTGGTTIGTTTGIVGPVTAVCDGSPIIVEFYTPYAYPAGITSAFINFVIFKDGAFAGFVGSTQTPAASADSKTLFFQWRDTPTAGIHTFEIRAYRDAGGGTAQAIGSVAAGWASTFIRVSKIVQASQFIVPLASVPSVTSLPTSPINGQEVNLYSQYGYTRQLWDGAQWNIVSDNRKVYFHANTSTILGTTAGTTMAFNRTTVNQGNCFNTSTYLFTAPFAGDYKFRVQAQKRNAGVMQMYWLINGSTTNNRGVYTDIGSDSVGPNMEIILNLAANTTVGVYYTLSAGDVYGGSTEYFTYFQGEYLA